MYQRPKEVVDLARMRYDRENGEGTFDAFEAIAFGPRNVDAKGTRVSTVIDGFLLKALDRAENDIRDMLKAIPGLACKEGASPWLKSVFAGGKAGDPHAGHEPARGSLMEFADLAIEALQERARVGGTLPGGIRVLDSAEGGCRPQEPMKAVPFLQAMWLVEADLQLDGTHASAVCSTLELRRDAQGVAMGRIASLFGRVTAPSMVVLCLVGRKDGGRLAVVMPDGVPSERRELMPDGPELLALAYAPSV